MNATQAQPTEPLAIHTLNILSITFAFVSNLGRDSFIRVYLLNVPDVGYSRNESCALNLISTFLLLSLGRYLCWWTISPWGYHPPSSQWFGTDVVY